MDPSISNNRVRDAVKTVNGIAPDVNGEVTTPVYVQTINGNSPDVFGSIIIDASIDVLSSNNTIQASPTGFPWQYDFQARVSGSFTNGIGAFSDWLYMSNQASDLQVTPYGSFPSSTNVQSALQQLSDSAISVANDSDTVNLSAGGGAITAYVKIDPATDNLLSESVAGLKASNNAIDIKSGNLAGYWFPSGTDTVRDWLIYLGMNRVISQVVDWVGTTSNPFLADTSINWRTGSLVNEYMQRFTNPYWVPWYNSEFGIVANTNLGSGIALTFSRFGDDTERYTIWVDSTGKFRIKSGALPTADTNGVVVGTQS